jgi:hypothetical protein
MGNGGQYCTYSYTKYYFVQIATFWMETVNVLRNLFTLKRTKIPTSTIYSSYPILKQLILFMSLITGRATSR